MRAVNLGTGEVTIAEVPKPAVGSHDLLVKVEAAGLNAGDLHRRPGLNFLSETLLMRGHEFAGTVVEIGTDATKFAVGDRVMGLSHRQEGLAEFAILPEQMAMGIPDSLTMIEAGGFPEAFLVAADAIFNKCGMQKDDRVLITGAAGGVGSAAVQLAIASGAHVVASVRDKKKHDGVAGLGAVVALPDDAYGLGPFDVILELVSSENVQRDIEALATDGNICLTGNEAAFQTVDDGVLAVRDRNTVAVDFQALADARGHLHAAGMGNRSTEEKALVARQAEQQIFPFLASGAVRVLVDSTFKFDDIKDAVGQFRRSSKLGKIVICF